MEDRKEEDVKVHISEAVPARAPASDAGGATLHSAPSVDLGANSAIGRRLKAYYDDVASEPVPDRFLSLLDALDAAESGAKHSDRK